MQKSSAKIGCCVLATVGLVCFTSAPSRAAVLDALKITDGTGAVVVNFSKTDENAGSQFFMALQVGVIPNIQNFKAGTLFFKEPPGEDTPSILTTVDDPPVDISSKKFSDGLSINGSLLTGKFNVFFISDGASADNAKMFPIFATQFDPIVETGMPQDVSATFGFPAGSIIVTSDVPEPATRLYLATGLLGLLGYKGSMLARRPK